MRSLDQYHSTGRAKNYHTLIVEAVLGKPLPLGAVVHHINGLKGDNNRGNLLVCQDQAYHMLLHLRMRALTACGNPDFRKCVFCKVWCDPSTMALNKRKGKLGTYYHSACVAADQLQRWRVKNPDRQHRKETYVRASN